jgi:glyoxylase-like metal-dependent hydrolase (beta-lactamase superfamily II)
LNPQVTAFFDEATFTVSYVVSDPAGRGAAIIDSVLDYDPKSGRTSTESADRIVEHVRAGKMNIEWILETHVHADHLSAGAYLKAKLGGRMAIGDHVSVVQAAFKKIFNAESAFRTDGSQFDHLFRDGEGFAIGNLHARTLYTPGHTPACVTYLIGDAAFIGDTLFMPDYGTARTDFPGGDAATLYRSIQRIFGFLPDTRLFLCHDYKAPGRDHYAWETTVAQQMAANLHIHAGISEADFVRMRTERDKTLSMPVLILPSVQVNMRGGHFPPPEGNGVSYLKIPLNAF